MAGNFTLEFEIEPGHAPVLTWLEKLDDWKYAAALAALEHVLAHHGKDVCKTEWGKNLGSGLYELRIRHSAAEIRHMFADDDPRGAKEAGRVLLRIFFHPYGHGRIVLLHGYDKGTAPGERAQQRAIERAHANLRAFNGARVGESPASRRFARSG